MADTGLPKNFEKVVALLDSTQPGEQAAAFGTATRMLIQAGLKWRDVVKRPPEVLHYKPLPDEMFANYQRQEAAWGARAAHSAADRIRQAAERELHIRRARDAKILKGIRNISRTVNYVLTTHNDRVFPWELAFLNNVQWASSEDLTEDQFNKYEMIVNRVLKASQTA